MKSKKTDEPTGPTQEEAAAVIAQVTDELQKKLGDGTRIVVIASRVGPGTWGYSWSVRGDALGVLGLLKHAGQKIQEWLTSSLG